MGSLIDIGKLTKPATVLIERVSDAVGGIAKPWQIKRVARAEAEAEIIRAEAQIEISDVQRRAIERMIREEGRNQQNIERITEKAIPHLETNATPENIDIDWLTYFFERARLTSDEEMQSLWANLLAQEANSPGKFSKRSVEVVAILGKADATLFTKLCQFGFTIDGKFCCLIYNDPEKPSRDFDLTFFQLAHLDALGLIRFDSSSFGLLKLPKNIQADYFGTHFNMELCLTQMEEMMLFGKPRPERQAEFTLDIGNVMLTQTGRELATVCGATPSKNVYDAVLDHLVNQGIVLYSSFQK